jgi:hypothetical protein
VLSKSWSLLYVTRSYAQGIDRRPQVIWRFYYYRKSYKSIQHNLDLSETTVGVLPALKCWSHIPTPPRLCLYVFILKKNWKKISPWNLTISGVFPQSFQQISVGLPLKVDYDYPVIYLSLLYSTEYYYTGQKPPTEAYLKFLTEKYFSQTNHVDKEQSLFPIVSCEFIVNSQSLPRNLQAVAACNRRRSVNNYLLVRDTVAPARIPAGRSVKITSVFPFQMNQISCSFKKAGVKRILKFTVVC